MNRVMSQSPFGSVPVGPKGDVMSKHTGMSQSPFGSVPVGRPRHRRRQGDRGVSIAFRLCPGRTKRNLVHG